MASLPARGCKAGKVGCRKACRAGLKTCATQSNANAGVQRDWDLCTAIKAKICRKDSLRGPVEFQTRRGLQSGSKLTRSKDGSEMEFSGRYRRAPASQAAAW